MFCLTVSFRLLADFSPVGLCGAVFRYALGKTHKSMSVTATGYAGPPGGSDPVSTVPAPGGAVVASVWA